MDLIKRYVYEVTRRLPEKMQEDVALELQSTIEDMLPDHPSEKDIRLVLTNLGDPAVLARRYSDRPSYLIGPALYEQYLNVLKLVLPIIIIIAIISVVAGEILSFSGDTSMLTIVLSIMIQASFTAVGAGIQAVFWITLIFVVIERTTNSEEVPFGKAWTPDQLKNKPAIPKNRLISNWELAGGLLWTAIAVTVYLNSSSLIAIYKQENGEDPNKVSPIFNESLLTSFWPYISLLVGSALALIIYKWFLKQWTMKLAVINTLYNVLWVVLVSLMISHPELFNPAAVTELEATLQTDLSNVTQWARLTVIITAVVFSGIDIFEGFRKARKGWKYKKLEVKQVD
ncbi:HAAS signaling domain-containing protein [Halobacillus sp. K22]|uniref:HAAS signaling domain-containing protein n=1 Tax=Halobacillus sp. K22 TaxID=3457431 RepID=UPI003FCC4761